MKINFLLVLASGCCFSGAAAAESEWVHRSLMGNTIASPKCTAKNEAMENASKSNNINEFAKRFCATQGYGWALEHVKDNGKIICEACNSDNNSDKYLCHVEDIVAECKRIRPGSVGMLPGKG
jgi:putative hemolysin